MSVVYYGFLIHCKSEVCVGDITSYLPEDLLSGTQFSFGRNGKQDFFNSEAPGGRPGVQSNTSFIFGVLSKCSEGAYWISEQSGGMGR